MFFFYIIQEVIIINIYKKNYLLPQYIIFFCVYSINIPNTKQNNGIEHINKETNLLQDRLKNNEKSLNLFQNGLIQIARIRVKKGQMKNLSQTKKNTKYS